MIEYTPLHGFHDLREWALPDKTFRLLAQAQEILSKAASKAEHLRTVQPDLWQRYRELAAAYQRVLFRYPHVGQQLSLFD